MIILDGPVGTELAARGVDTPAPGWSAAAIDEAPEVLAAIHRDYAEAGATVHTANTFRTQPRIIGPDWLCMAARAVAIARAAVPSGQRIAVSMAPLADCYRPESSPPHSRDEHRRIAEGFAETGADLILCETFPHLGEAMVATEEAIRTGLPVWLSLTAGPDADLLNPAQIGEGARRARDLGVQAVLVNCVPATRTLEFLAPLATLGIPFGAYANAGPADGGIGWLGSTSDVDRAAARYAELAQTWNDAGARILGGCCGTSPAHVRKLADLKRNSVTESIDDPTVPRARFPR